MTNQTFRAGIAAFAMIAVLGATSAVAGETYDRIKSIKKVVVGTEAAFPPFEFIEDGKIVGSARTS